ncbi:peptide deformylase [bacterium]|nr:peptide deformylase [bacterium]
MTVLKVKLYGNPALRKKCPEIEEVDGKIKKLLDNMAETMYHKKGIGLATPQVGILKRAIVVDVGEGLTALVNPKILWRQGKEIAPEGCLSLPGVFLEIKRSQEVVVEGIDKNGETKQIGATGLYARALQHEIDHLNGVLIIDHISRKKLKSIRKELEKISRGD